MAVDSKNAPPVEGAGCMGSVIIPSHAGQTRAHVLQCHTVHIVCKSAKLKEKMDCHYEEKLEENLEIW